MAWSVTGARVAEYHAAAMDANRIAIARLLNLVVPGAGLILVGRVLIGWALALAFAITANLAVFVLYIIPAEVNNGVRAAFIGSAAVLYIAAQGLFATAARYGFQAAVDTRLRSALVAANRFIADGDLRAALRALQDLPPPLESDLLVVLRVAQVLTALGDHSAAQAACERLRQLDRHGLCRADLAQMSRERQAAEADDKLLHINAVADAARR